MWRQLSLALFVLCFIHPGVRAQTFDPCGVHQIITTSVDISSNGNSADTIVADVGLFLSLRCDIILNGGTKFDPPPAVNFFVWTRNDVILSGFTEKTLHISNIASSDGGEYRCSGVTTLPCQSRESDITAVTTVPLVVLSPSNNLTAYEEEPFQITCEVAGWPASVVEWTQTTSEGTVVQVSTDPILVINSPTIGESNYTCNATNDRGNSQATITVTVNESRGLATTTDSVGGDGESGRNTGEGIINTTETEVGFYVALAFVVVGCLVLTLIAILSIVIWCSRKRSTGRREVKRFKQKQKNPEKSSTDHMY